MRRPRASGQFRYLAANDTSSAFDMTAGRRPLTWVSGVPYVGIDGATAGAAPHRVVLLNEFRGAQIQFYTSNGNNLTTNYRVWLITPCFGLNESVDGPDYNNALDVDVSCLIADTSTITFSTAAGLTLAGTSALVASTDEIADTLTFTLATTATTPAGPGTVIGAAYQLGDIAVFSPANNTPATLYIPDFGAGVQGFAIDFDMTGATDCNALIQLTK